MKRIVEIQGTPFTRTRKVSLRTEDPDELLDGLRKLTRTLQDPWEQQRPLIDWIKSALEQEKARHSGNHQFRPHVDDGWYFEQMVIHANIVDDHIAKGDPSWAAQHGAIFGSLWTEWQLKTAREKPFLVGRKIADAFAGTREESNDRRRRIAAANWARWNAAAADVRRRHPEWKILAIARQVKRELNLTESVETIRKRLKKSGEAG